MNGDQVTVMVRWNRRPHTRELRTVSDDLRKQFLASADRLDEFARALAAAVDENDEGGSDGPQRPAAR